MIPALILRRLSACAVAVAVAGCSAVGIGQLVGWGTATSGPPWFGFAENAQHSAQSQVKSQPIDHIHWRTPVDLAPQYSSGELLIHYGPPVITHNDTVLLAVKTGATQGFRIEAHGPVAGALKWKSSTDYIVPPHPSDWFPSYDPALTPGDRLYFAGAGGKLFYRDGPDSTANPIKTVVFYGASQYSQHKSVYNAEVYIDTPLTTDGQGDVYFGFVVAGATPANLQSGVARIDANGNGSWVGIAAAAGDGSMQQVPANSAPALSNDGQTLYVAATNTSLIGGGGFGSGYLLALDSTTLATKGKIFLHDPQSGQPAVLFNSSSASPAVGPDGDVYYGVLENPFPNHNDRGWMLHFDGALSQTKVPGSFGWDDTVSIVPASAVPSYVGTSSYLLMTKYNNYAGVNTGDGKNRIAILDPNASQPDLVYGNPVMKEVITILGVTPNPGEPGVREWCINTAAVDPIGKVVLANSEDGYLYRWDLTKNAFSSRIQLTSGIGEAYTPTEIGPDGQVYAINNAVLFAVGR